MRAQNFSATLPRDFYLATPFDWASTANTFTPDVTLISNSQTGTLSLLETKDETCWFGGFMIQPAISLKVTGPTTGEIDVTIQGTCAGQQISDTLSIDLSTLSTSFTLYNSLMAFESITNISYILQQTDLAPIPITLRAVISPSISGSDYCAFVGLFSSGLTDPSNYSWSVGSTFTDLLGVTKMTSGSTYYSTIVLATSSSGISSGLPHQWACAKEGNTLNALQSPYLPYSITNGGVPFQNSYSVFGNPQNAPFVFATLGVQKGGITIPSVVEATLNFSALQSE